MCIIICSIRHILLILEKSELNLKEVKGFALLSTAGMLEVLELDPRCSFRLYTLHYSALPPGNTAPTWASVSDAKRKRTISTATFPVFLIKKKRCAYVELVKNDIWQQIKRFQNCKQGLEENRTPMSIMALFSIAKRQRQLKGPGKVKQDVAPSCNGILFSLQKKGNFETCCL